MSIKVNADVYQFHISATEAKEIDNVYYNDNYSFQLVNENNYNIRFYSAEEKDFLEFLTLVLEI